MTAPARVVGAIVGAALLVGAWTSPAAADSAGPTDYRTEIVAVEPASEVIEVEMIGGDSFVRMTVQPGHEVVVFGYRGEPYLTFRADGEVVENRRSPATWLNQERYGGTDLPSFVDHEAPPQWVTVATDGSWVWHDHRTHWMNDSAPPGATPGDQVLEAAVPILVDDRATLITVASFMLAGPGPAALIVGVPVAVLAAAMIRLRRHRRDAAIVAMAALAALGTGVVALTSVPAETEPSQLLWLLPAVGLGAAIIVVVTADRMATTVYLDGLLVTGGVALAGWAVTRFDALFRALIPSSMPGFVDRITICIALAVGIVAAVTGLVGLVRPQRLAAP